MRQKRRKRETESWWKHYERKRFYMRHFKMPFIPINHSSLNTCFNKLQSYLIR